MGILEETKVAQVINRLEDTRALLTEMNTQDNRFNEKITQINNKLAGFEKELREIKEQLNIENLGVKKQN
jgi:DNA-binding IscR family transcriptional regulator